MEPDMTSPIDSSGNTRRQFIKQSASVAAGAAALSAIAPFAYAADDQTIRLALIGCGGRGAGAVGDALNVPNYGPIKLHAMADLDMKKIDLRLKALKKRFGDKVDVPNDRKFVGWDAYKKAVATLRAGDVALCTTRAYIRPTHVEYAVNQGINVFMEKPFATDTYGLHRLLKVHDVAEKKGVKIAAGLQCRHSPARMALIDQIHNGAIGDISYIRADRLGRGGWLRDVGEKANSIMEHLSFGRSALFWVGSGHMVDNLIHQIDECCWLKGEWPVSCHGMGGRVPHSTDRGQNIDVYQMEFTFADGVKAFCGFRRIRNCRNAFATFVHGTKCAAQFSGPVHRAIVHRYKDHRIDENNIAWKPTDDEFRPWQYEWNNFIASIRRDAPHNECKRAVYSDLTTLMGRAACHTGQIVTWDQMMKSRFRFCDYVDTMGYDSPPPVKPDADGWFPIPVPGKWTEL